MDKLFRQVNTWMHYIGGHYETPEQFIREAEQNGVSRRIPAQVARGMNYGDRVILLRYYGKGSVCAFAEMTITSVILPCEISDQVGKALQDNGKASYSPGGGVVQRECGSFMILGTWNVNAELPEIMSMAIEIAERDRVEMLVMVSGKLSKVYDAPTFPSPAPNFTRGFIRVDELAEFEFHDKPHEREQQVVSITGYKKKERRTRKASSLALAPMM